MKIKIKNPEISVVMSVYNGEKYLDQSIKSILNQTFKDYEFIIIDDGSTDYTSKILSSYKDERIKIVKNEKNIGLTKSLNLGIRLAKGEYIARQDADDISDPSRLEKLFNVFEKDKYLGLVGSSFKIIDSNHRILRIVNVPTAEEDIRNIILDHNPFCHGSVMFKREVINKIGGYREFFRYAQDYDLWLRISENYRILNIGEVLYGWRKVKDSISEEKIIEQFQYAMIAISQFMIRKKEGKDEIDKGLIPKKPMVRYLTKGLKKQLLNHHFINMIDSLRSYKIIEAMNEFRSYIKIKSMMT